MTGILNLLAGAVGVVKDTYFNLVTLLLPGNGTNGAQNNTFLDSSTNNFTITRNGNTTQGTFSPFSQTGWGNYFGGSDYLSASSNTAFQLGTGDWTVEYFVFATSFSNSPSMVDTRVLSSGNGYSDYFNTSGKYLLFWANATKYTSTATLAVNTWYHIAVCRSSGTVSVYINGSRDGTFSDSTNLSDSNLRIGNNQGASNGLTGYLSSVRIVKGTAVYSGSTITVPTSALTNITNTSLLTCQSNRFIDNSSNAFALTATGTPSVQAFSPFAPTAAYSAATNGGSGYFDGTGDYLTAPDNAAFSFGSGNFTVELWVYLNSSTSGASISFVAQGSAGFDTDSSWYFLRHSSDKLRFISTTDGGIPGITIVDSTNSFLPTTGQWYHLAAVRNGTTITLYVNGVSVGSGTNSTTFYDSTRAVGICSGSAGTDPINGYVSSLRIVKGTAVYTAGFTPPTSPLTNITNTSLLLNFTNAGITDATAKNDLETVGNAQISTTQSKFGGSSMYFDGTGDELYFPSGTNFDLGTTYTIECWVYPSSVASGFGIILRGSYDAGTSNWTGLQFSLRWIPGAGLKAYFYGTTAANEQVITSSSTALVANQWQHIAMVRNGTNGALYIDGVSVGTISSLNTPAASTQPIRIGNWKFSAGDFYLNGYIDDFRITKGYARYTSAFTPPTAPFALQ